MKKTLICPKCEGRKIWRIPRMVERGQGGWNGVHPLPVVSAPAEVLGLALGQGFEGTFELFSCASCGFCEMYAHGLNKLAEDTYLDPEIAQLIDNTPESTLR